MHHLPVVWPLQMLQIRSYRAKRMKRHALVQMSAF